MSCCGKKRTAHWRGDPPQAPAVQQMSPRAVYFRYVGTASLTVVGPVTGRVYKFSGSGSAAATDPRDAPSIAAVPHLVQVTTL
jgi:hypothetical protein